MNKTLILLIALFVIATAGLVVAFGDTAATPGSTEDPVVTKSYVDAKTVYQVVHMQAGQKMVGKAGTELIVRSGEVTAIDNGVDGLSDITGGTDLKTGTTCKINHLLLVPRDDGRGVKAGTEAYVMVRGGFTLN